MKKTKLSLAIGLLVAGFNAYASDDLSVLKAQIAAQQAQLEKMMQQMQALEAKAQQVEAKVTPTAAPASVTTEQKAASGYQGSLDQARAASRKLSDPVKVGGIKRNPFSGSNMNPDVAVILDGSYVNRSQSNSAYGALGMPGFFHELGGAHEGHAHGGGYNLNNGFNLNYGELVFSAAVDKYFDLFAVIHAGESGAALEEAYANTRSLPFNTQLKFGKFLSGFGRLNGQHHHYWDFADQPLIYQGVFGSHGLLEKGVQATWLAPTRNYLLFGAEALQGDNEQSFGTKAISVKSDKTFADKDTAFASQVDGAGLAVGFVKTGFDLGNTSWMAGASYGAGKMRLDHTSDEHGPHAKAGSVAITGLDLTGKYFLDATRYLMWQSEYIKRELTDGQVATYPSNSGGASDGLITPKLSQNQSGYYSQLIWKFAPQWRTGLRYDAIDQNSIKVAGTDKNTPYGDRNTVMVEYNPTEFSRIRLQYAQNGAFFTEENERKRFDEVLLQFNMAIGAHGAHSF